MKNKWKQTVARMCGRQLAVRIFRSVFFWSITGLLAASSFRDARKILTTGAQVPAGSEMTLQGKQEQDGSEMILQGKQERAGSDSALQEDLSDPEGRYEAAEAKRVALTFDDGPHPVYTELLLDGLAERGIHATFFVVGENIEGNEALLARMDAEGHLIGNHTYDHVKICDLSGEEACEQVEKTSALVKEITGKNTEFVRPPFGAWNKEMECSFVMIPVLWDVDPLDWTTRNTELVVERVLDEVQDEDIILLHDYYQSSVEAALRIVDELRAQGYEFVTVDELILE